MALLIIAFLSLLFYSLYFDSMYCMKTVLTYSPNVECDPENLDTTVKDFMMDFLEVEAHTDAQMTCSAFPNSSYAEQFGDCTGKIFMTYHNRASF